MSVQLGPATANVEFADPIRGDGILAEAEVTVLPCGLIHIRPQYMSQGYREFTIPAARIKRITWNPFDRVLDYGERTVAREIASRG